MIFNGKKMNEDPAESAATPSPAFMRRFKRTDLVWLWTLVTFTLLALVLPTSSQAAEQAADAGTPAGMTIWPEPRLVPEVQFGAAEWDRPEVIEYLRDVIASSQRN